MESEICNSTIVSLIEEKLPSNVKANWCLEVSDKESKVNERNKFLQLLEFLLKHKRAIEYGSNDLRLAKQRVLHFSVQINHIESSHSWEERKSSNKLSATSAPFVPNEEKNPHAGSMQQLVTTYLNVMSSLI